MAQGTMLQKISRLAGAAVIAGALFGSVTAAPTFASVNKGNLPDGTKCERVSVNFTECTTPDGTKYWCTDDGTCEKAPLIVRGGNIRVPTDGLVMAPDNETDPAPVHPIVVPTAGFFIAN
jgi:hypothetical protein